MTSIDVPDTLEDDIDIWHLSVPEMTCDSCLKPETSVPLKNCSACHLVWYCDTTCQRNHWKTHKNDCQRVTDRKKSIQSSDSSLSSLGPTNSQVRFLARSTSSSSSEILNLLKECVLLVDRAENKQPKPSQEERMHFLNTASEKVKQIFDIDPDHNQGLFLAAQIHFYKGELNTCISRLEELLDPQFGPPLITDDADKITILVLIGKSYLKMRQFSTALLIYGRAWEIYQAACKCCVKSSNQKFILSGISQCSYEIGVYDEAIETGLKAIWFNRHYNESYEYVIMSYQKLGNWDKSLGWMKRALRYEAPWNEDIVRKNKQMYEDLLLARESAVTSMTKPLVVPSNTATKSIAASSSTASTQVKVISSAPTSSNSATVPLSAPSSSSSVATTSSVPSSSSGSRQNRSRHKTTTISAADDT